MNERMYECIKEMRKREGEKVFETDRSTNISDINIRTACLS